MSRVQAPANSLPRGNTSFNLPPNHHFCRPLRLWLTCFCFALVDVCCCECVCGECNVPPDVNANPTIVTIFFLRRIGGIDGDRCLHSSSHQQIIYASSLRHIIFCADADIKTNSTHYHIIEKYQLEYCIDIGTKSR